METKIYPKISVIINIHRTNPLAEKQIERLGQVVESKRIENYIQANIN